MLYAATSGRCVTKCGSDFNCNSLSPSIRVIDYRVSVAENLTGRNFLAPPSCMSGPRLIAITAAMMAMFRQLKSCTPPAPGSPFGSGGQAAASGRGAEAELRRNRRTITASSGEKPHSTLKVTREVGSSKLYKPAAIPSTTAPLPSKHLSPPYQRHSYSPGV